VLTWLNVQNPGTPGEGVSVKVMCPFSETHPPDRSGEKDMRIYSDGKAFCHMCATQYDSVGLAAQAWGLTRVEAARAVLSRAGLDVSSEEDWESQLSAPSPEQMRTSAVAALGVWADAQQVDRFDPRYSACLEAADQIQSAEHVDMWLDACKAFLRSNNA
jgi:hypothetical protein